MTPWRWLGQKLAENDPATTNTRRRPADAPVVALPGHRLTVTRLKDASRYLAKLCPSHRFYSRDKCLILGRVKYTYFAERILSSPGVSITSTSPTSMYWPPPVCL
ncbi:MAG TPA: hypothetical protein PK867_26760, partial [Pirellulales bacterium]|nr:hypothetical protein [Pirellulales bacterium]